AKASMKTIEATMAVTITQRSSTMPTAVMIESNENTISSTMIWAMTAMKLVAAPGATCSEAPSSFWWISWVALPMRNRPPPIRIRSRHENAWPNSENRGAVSPMIHAIMNSRPRRVTAAPRMPSLRARSRCASGSLPARIEMKMMLSMPRTSSSAVSVASAIQISGFASASMGFSFAKGQTRRRLPAWVREGLAHTLEGAAGPERVLVLTAVAIGSYSPSSGEASTPAGAWCGTLPPMPSPLTRTSATPPPSRLQLPPGRWTTLLDGLCSRFPQVGREQWQSRFRRGRVQDVRGQPLAADSPYVVGAEVRYFREVEQEPVIPFEAAVLHVDEHLVVVDKPHFLPVVPAGGYVEQTLLARMVKDLGNPALVPLHRIDRGTAGLVLFSANPA